MLSEQVCQGCGKVYDSDERDLSEVDLGRTLCAPCRPKSYRKKPLTITALQLPPTGGDPEPFMRWAKAVGFTAYTSERDDTLAITTLEGTMTAGPGDWIIRGVKGEFYPVKADIFAATYDELDPETGEPVRRCENCDAKNPERSDSEGVPLCDACFILLPPVCAECDVEADVTGKTWKCSKCGRIGIMQSVRVAPS